MSDTIVMRHPNLPERQEIEVPRDSMPHYTAAGWQRVPDEELQHRAAKARAEAEARAAEEAADAKRQDQSDSTSADQLEDEPDAPAESEPAEEPTRPARSRTRATKKDEEN